MLPLVADATTASKIVAVSVPVEVIESKLSEMPANLSPTRDSMTCESKLVEDNEVTGSLPALAPTVDNTAHGSPISTIPVVSPPFQPQPTALDAINAAAAALSLQSDMVSDDEGDDDEDSEFCGEGEDDEDQDENVDGDVDPTPHTLDPALVSDPTPRSREPALPNGPSSSSASLGQELESVPAGEALRSVFTSVTGGQDPAPPRKTQPRSQYAQQLMRTGSGKQSIVKPAASQQQGLGAVAAAEAPKPTKPRVPARPVRRLPAALAHYESPYEKFFPEFKHIFTVSAATLPVPGWNSSDAGVGKGGGRDGSAKRQAQSHDMALDTATNQVVESCHILAVIASGSDWERRSADAVSSGLPPPRYFKVLQNKLEVFKIVTNTLQQVDPLISVASYLCLMSVVWFVAAGAGAQLVPAPREHGR